MAKVKKKPRRLPPGVELLEDGRYRVRVTWTDEATQKRKAAEETLEVGATEAQAVARRDELRAEVKALGAPKPKPTGEPIPTLASYSASWMKYTAPRVRKVTADRYAHTLEAYVLPLVGGITLDAFSRPALRDFRDKLEAGLGRGLGHKSQNNVWSILLRVLRAGLGDHGLPDPTQGLEGPREKPCNDPLERLHQDQERAIQRPPNWVAPGHVHVLTRAQLARLVDAASGLAPHRASIVLLLATTGMRLNEVRLQLRQDLHLGEDAWVVASHSKTAQGQHRRIPVPKVVAEIIERHLATSAPSPWLFPMMGRPSEPCSKHMPWDLLRVARAKADELEAAVAKQEGREPDILPPISPHDLRRTYITLMHREGVDRLVVRSLVGHTRDAMTDHYVKLGDQDRRGALKVIEGGLGKEKAG